MVSSPNGGSNGGSYDEMEATTAPLLPSKLKDDDIRIDIPPPNWSSSGGVLDFLRTRLPVDWFVAPFSIFRRTVDLREEASLSVPSPAGIRRRFHMRFMRKIDWVSLRKLCKEWAKNPMNIALLLWLICVACFLSLLFLLLTEMVDGAFPTTASRNRWIEICNQVLNALFTLMSLYQHPNLFHHLVLLCRWRSDDIVELRKVYCKNGAYRPREWAHMTVVVFLLHIACCAQYVLCGLYWGYRSGERPEFAEDLFVVIGVLAPVLAGVYTVYSALGREFDSDTSDGESQGQGIDLKKKHSKPGLKLREQRVAVSRPEWTGGLFDLGDDVSVTFLSFFCTFCVFGWNMGRLGFGNMYVHTATFVLLFIAPYWIFSISAVNIHDVVIRHAVRITGLVLSLLCFLYGGFWRIEIRRRFGLPANTFCCGDGSWTDYAQWMFCWGCSLAQEVRTGNSYDVEDDSLYRKHGGGGGGGDEDDRQPMLPPPSSPCDAAGGENPVLGSSSGSVVSTLACPGRGEEERRSPGSELLAPEVGSSTGPGGDVTMTPPSPPLMQVENKDWDHSRDDRLTSPGMKDSSLPSE